MKWTKFKVTKIPAQKSPSRFASMDASKVAEKSARAKFGEAPEYMGMSQKSMTDLAAESYAMKAENKMFFRTLKKELKASRLKTAGGVKGLRASGKKVPKASIFKAKQKGALKAYKTAETKSQTAFTKITQRSIKVKPRNISNDALKAMGLEDRIVSGMRRREYKTFKDTARGSFNIFKPKKKRR